MNVRHWLWLTLLAVPLTQGQAADGVVVRDDSSSDEDHLAAYRSELDGFRQEYGGARDLPDVRFFLFGLGQRMNFFVYSKPWYRDGAMMALAFRETGNLGLIRDWILGLREPYDRNNGGVTEPDNLGQALFLVSLVSDRGHPLVPRVLAELPRFERQGPQGKYLVGQSDFAEHPVYQTKWLKYGLRALGLPDEYQVPALRDGYSALFWMDYRESHLAGTDSIDRANYPYLGWACDHFYGRKTSPLGNRDYPLTWEQNASQANYAGLAVLDPVYAAQKLSAPHTWHAAEVFLYVLSDVPGRGR